MCSQEYPVNAGVSQGLILGPVQYIDYFLMALFVIVLSIMMMRFSTLSLIEYLIN